MASASEPAFRACGGCGALDPSECEPELRALHVSAKFSDTPLLACPCRMATYCSVACQRAALPAHKAPCKALRAMVAGAAPARHSTHASATAAIEAGGAPHGLARMLATFSSRALEAALLGGGGGGGGGGAGGRASRGRRAETADDLVRELTRDEVTSMMGEALFGQRAVIDAALRHALAALGEPHFAAALLVLARVFAFYDGRDAEARGLAFLSARAR